MFLGNGLRAGPQGDAGHDFWFQPVQPNTASGTIVTHDRALRHSMVFKCVKVLSETVALLPRHLYQLGEGDGRTRLREHPLARLLSHGPNRWQTPFQFVAMMEAHCQLRGNAYARIYYGRDGQPQELVPLHPERVTMEISRDGMPRWRVRPARPEDGEEVVLVQGEMLHLAGMCLDGYSGISPITQQRESIGTAIATRDYGARFWNNDARPPFWIKVPGKFEQGEDKRSFREQWQEAYGGSNRGKPAVLDRGMEIVPLGLTNVDAQWLEASKATEIDICGIYRMPPHKVGILDDAKWANIEQQAIEFVTDAILPPVVRWEQALWRDLIVEEDIFVEFLVEQLLRGDTKSRYEAYSKGIQDGWLTRNEVRRRENLNPLPGLDEPLQPLNMTRASGLPNVPGGTSGPRAAMLLQANAARVARREAGLLARRKPEETVAAVLAGHERFVADVMAVSAEAAAEHCAATVASAEMAHAEGVSFESPAWVQAQIAALMRLEG